MPAHPIRVFGPLHRIRWDLLLELGRVDPSTSAGCWAGEALRLSVQSHENDSSVSRDNDNVPMRRH
jgi:hypothetical protein